MFPELKKRLKSFVISEKGSISKQSVLAIGAFLTGASIGLVKEARAGSMCGNLDCAYSCSTSGLSGSGSSCSSPGHANSLTSSYDKQTGTVTTNHSHSVSSSCGGGCFIEGTLILTPFGMKAINSLNVGDEVYSSDKKKLIKAKIKEKYVHDNENSFLHNHGRWPLLEIKTNNNITLNVTANHPFFIPRLNDWLDVESIDLNEKLAYFDEDGNYEEVELIEKKILDDKPVVYNLEIDHKHHNYLAMGLMVHNICCFPAGTMVLMANGTRKRIEKVKIGDRVKCYSIKNRKLADGKVTALEKPIREGLYTIKFKDGSKLRTTNDHPLYIKKGNGRKGWAAIDAKEAKKNHKMKEAVLKLEKGDYVLKNNLTYSKIVKITYKKGKVQTYNLRGITGYNNFFANGCLVHNKGDTSGGGGGGNSNDNDGPGLGMGGSDVGNMCGGSGLSGGTCGGFSGGSGGNSGGSGSGSGGASFGSMLSKTEGSYTVSVVEGGTTVGSVTAVDYGGSYIAKDASGNTLGSYSDIDSALGAFGGDASGADCSAGNSCFLSGTKILMLDGNLKPIEEINEGEFVIAYNKLYNKNIPSQVLKRFVHKNHTNRYALINNEIKVTNNHLFYVNNKWEKVENIKEGDLLLDNNGKQVTVEEIKQVEEDNLFDVYNIEVDSYHTYYAAGILVHNKSNK